MVLIETRAYKMKTRIIHFATAPTHENAGGIFLGNRGCDFYSKRWQQR